MVAGLGNPGKEYERTRHNVGFMAVERLAAQLHLDAWKTKDGARQLYDASRRLILVEPQTFMNNSGAPLRIVASWYRVPAQNVLAIYDEMDLPFGTIRMRPFGGHGGHNGMRSMIATMTEQFPRIRIGVGRPQYDSIDHVLSPFTAEEAAKLPEILDAAAEGARLWLEDGLEAAMQFINNHKL